MKKPTYTLLIVCCLVFSNIAKAQTPEQCLASAIFHEARGEDLIGKKWVAYVVINRGKKVGNICKAIKKPKQFSWYRKKSDLKKYDQSSIILARKLLKTTSIPDILYFHANHVPFKQRAWTKNLTFVAKVGNHTFYKD